MNDESCLLSAIRSNPDDDTARLVYADWLDENGRPERAAFIRSQIDSSLRGEPDSQATRKLFEKCWREWFGHLIPDGFSPFSRFSSSILAQYRNPSIFTFDPTDSRVETWTPNAIQRPDYNCWWLVQRGFISTVRGTFSHWENHADRLCQDQPLTEVILSTVKGFEFQTAAMQMAMEHCPRQWPSVRTWTMTGDDSRFRITQK